MSVLMPFQTLSGPSHGCSVLMSTDWLTVRVPPAAGLAAAGAWGAGTAVGWATAWGGVGGEGGRRGAGVGRDRGRGRRGGGRLRGLGGLSRGAGRGRRGCLAAGGQHRRANGRRAPPGPPRAGSPRAARARNPRRVSESAGRVCIVNASDPDQPDVSGLSNRVNPCA